MYLWAVPDGCLNILEWNFNWPCGYWPQSWPAPSLLEKFTRFSNVMISHTQSQAFFSVSLLFVFLSFFCFLLGVFLATFHIERRWSLPWPSSGFLCALFSVLLLMWEFQTAKCLCLRRGIKGQEDNLCQRYRFVFSCCSLCSTMMYSLCGCEEEEMRSASLSQSSSLYAGVQS